MKNKKMNQYSNRNHMALKITVDAGFALRIVVLVVMVVLDYVSSVETASIRVSRAKGDIGIAIQDGHALFSLDTFSDVLLDGLYPINQKLVADPLLAAHFTAWVCVSYSFFVSAGVYLFLFEEYTIGPTIFVGMLMSRLCGILYWTPLIPGSIAIEPLFTSFGLVKPPTEIAYFFNEHVMVMIVVSGFLIKRGGGIKMLLSCTVSVLMLIMWLFATRRSYTADVVTSLFASLALLLSVDKLKPLFDDVFALPVCSRFDCKQSISIEER